jgi:hypothetical protein
MEKKCHFLFAKYNFLLSMLNSSVMYKMYDHLFISTQLRFLFVKNSSHAVRSQSESCSETNIAVHRKYGVLLQYYISYKHVVQTSTKSDDQVFFSGSSSSLHTYTCIYITKVIYLKPCKQRYLRSSIIDLIKPSLGVQS